MNKNVQVIDGAINCTYDIFSMPEEDFKQVFPNGQDVEFIEDVIERLGKKKTELIIGPIWKHRQNKATVQGIHGTLFYELSKKKPFYPNKNEAQMIASPQKK
jgi:hypothetical protein